MCTRGGKGEWSWENKYIVLKIILCIQRRVSVYLVYLNTVFLLVLASCPFNLFFQLCSVRASGSGRTLILAFNQQRLHLQSYYLPGILFSFVLCKPSSRGKDSERPNNLQIVHIQTDWLFLITPLRMPPNPTSPGLLPL